MNVSELKLGVKAAPPLELDSLLVLVVFQSRQQVDEHSPEEFVIIVPLLKKHHKTFSVGSRELWEISRTPGVRRYQVFLHVHVLWFDETQLGSSLPHDADGPAEKKPHRSQEASTRGRHRPVLVLDSDFFS